MQLNFTKNNGLIPVVIQNWQTLEVLMLGYMNKAALKKTEETGLVTFYSRSKKRLWQKGETSGNFLKVVELKPDCDQDALLILAKPQGPTCHTGQQSCFGQTNFNLLQLFQLIQSRQADLPKNSYTTSLFEAGQQEILAKIEEETAEVIQAAKSEGRTRLTEESCDLIYHLFVLLVNEGIGAEELSDELESRRN